MSLVSWLTVNDLKHQRNVYSDVVWVVAFKQPSFSKMQQRLDGVMY